MTPPELVLGYVLASRCSRWRIVIILLYVIYVLQVHTPAIRLIFLVTALLTLGGVNMGIFISAFARNELQIVQFIPLVIVPRCCSAASSFR